MTDKNDLSKSQERAIKTLVEEERKEKLEYQEIDLGLILHLYHKTGRQPNKFREVLDNLMEGRQELLENIDAQISLCEKEKEKLKELKNSVVKEEILHRMK